MKRAFVILFSLLLIGGRGAFVFSPQAAEQSAACCRCHCGAADCCIAPPAPASRTIPAESRTSEARQDTRAVPDSQPRLLYAQCERDFIFPSEFLPDSGTTAVPLYERTCSYLI